jgi:hypothetical protein
VVCGDHDGRPRSPKQCQFQKVLFCFLSVLGIEPQTLCVLGRSLPLSIACPQNICCTSPQERGDPVTYPSPDETEHLANTLNG